MGTCVSTGYVCAYPLSSTKGVATAKALKTYVMMTTLPKVILTDGGPEYKSNFQEKIAHMGIRHHLTVAH